MNLLKQCPAHAVALSARTHIGMPDEIHYAPGLKPHNAKQLAFPG